MPGLQDAPWATPFAHCWASQGAARLPTFFACGRSAESTSPQHGALDLNRPLVTLLALCLLPAAALAQNDPGMGLDLTEDAKEPAKEGDAQTPPEVPPPAAASDAPVTTPAARSPDAEREITQDDRVKSVQR